MFYRDVSTRRDEEPDLDRVLGLVILLRLRLRLLALVLALPLGGKPVFCL